MTQHLGHQYFPVQAFSTYDPTAPIYYNGATPAPEHYAYQHQHLQYQQQQEEMQLNYHRLTAYIYSQHQDEAHKLQQDDILQQQQVMYHQQMLARQQQQQEQQQHHYQMIQSPSPGKRMQTKADKRAEHNAIERLRRENLNSKFQQLAHSLPNLQDDRRPSKGTIIERTLEFVKDTIQNEQVFLSEIRKLNKEYEDLMQQLYPGQKPPAHDSIFPDDEQILSDKGNSSPFSEFESQKLTSTSPSEWSLSEECPKLSPTSGSASGPGFEAYAMDLNPLNDVMFGHLPEQQQQQQQQQRRSTVSYESDVDSNSPSPNDLNLTSATFTSSISTMASAMTDKDANVLPAEYGIKIKSHHSNH